jgi:hypothetical protein
MIDPKAYQKRHAKARQRRRRAQERLAQDRRQAQQAAEALPARLAEGVGSAQRAPSAFCFPLLVLCGTNGSRRHPRSLPCILKPQKVVEDRQ